MRRGSDLDKLIARAQDGDARAFEELLADHLPLVRRFARAFTGSPSDADDLAQDALLKAYKSLRLFRYQSAFSSWLYAVVRNSFLDGTKSRAGRERAREDALQPGHVEAQPGGETADELIHREQERQRLWRALRQVPVEFRSALVLFDLEGCTYDEVASIEGVPVGTVKSRLSRGRAALRLLLGEQEEPSGGKIADSPGTSSATASSHPSRRGP
jgi:RNA polymerase sigma-70 factor (ECF subfamily)